MPEAAPPAAAPHPPAGPAPARPSRRTTARATSRRVLIADRAAGAIVRVGGFLVIAAVLGILVFLVATVLPLFRSATVRERAGAGKVPVEAPLHVLAIDEYRLLALAIGSAPEVVWFRLDNGEVVHRARIASLAGSKVVAARRTIRTNEAVVASASGEIALVALGFSSDFVLGQRAAALRVSMRPGDVVASDDGVVRRVAGGNMLRVRPLFQERGTVVVPDGAGRAVAVGYASGENGGAVAVATDAGRFLLARESVVKSVVGDETRSLEWADVAAGGPPVPSDVFAALVDEEVRTAWLASRAGILLRVDLTATPAVVRESRVVVRGPSSRLSAAEFTLGDRSLVLADEAGDLDVWSPVPRSATAKEQAEDRAAGRPERDGRETVRLHAFEPFSSPVVHVASGTTRRTLYLGHADGTVSVAYSVNERVLGSVRTFTGPVAATAPGGKDDGFVTVGPGLGYRAYDVEAPHPETTLQSLFAPVHYEGHAEPEYVWQSSAGTDEAEPKFCLTPLLFGTLKGTFYAMLFALPVALLAALYTSRFMHPRVRNVVKPGIEVMASLPSVVLGFFAALVIAPALASFVPAVFATLFGLAVVGFLAGVVWHGLPLEARQAVSSAARLSIAVGLVLLVAGVAVLGNGVVQRTLFSGPDNLGGDFAKWLLGKPGGGSGTALLAVALFGLGAALGAWLLPRHLRLASPSLSGMRGGVVKGLVWGVLPGLALAAASSGLATLTGFDFRRFLVGDGTVFQVRNSLVVGIAMGFAVIPLIYTIAEDALSAIPDSLTSAALACGASPWQAAVRVVVPAAAPGIFSATMIGLGRAVGETMIVLMATGGTAILDPSVFNGFRSLSANVATELSEAPKDGTHYRVLFLAALLLFALTFAVNTVAEIVRIRFRKRFRAL